MTFEHQMIALGIGFVALVIKDCVQDLREKRLLREAWAYQQRLDAAIQARDVSLLP